MYLKYSDIAIFSDLSVTGKLNIGLEPLDANRGSASTLFAATEASLSLDANLAPNRYLGAAQKSNDFSITGPLQGKFSLTFCPLIEKQPVGAATTKLNIQRANQLSFFDLTGYFNSTWFMGSYKLKKTFLQNYSIKINPYQPVMVTANFISYDVSNISTTSITGYYQEFPLSTASTLSVNKQNTTNTAYYESLHGLTTTVNRTPELPDFISPYAERILANNFNPNATTNVLPKYNLANFTSSTYASAEYPPDILLPASKLSIEINVDCQRTPVYQLGSFTPSDVILTAVERTVTVQGEDIGSAIDINGGNPGALSINFLPLSARNDVNPIPSSTNNVLKFNISGRVVSQQLSVAQNAMVNGRVVIKEIIL